jgi:hypothetical protein
MTHYLRNIVLAGALVGTVSGSSHAAWSSLPSLGGALAGDALTLLGATTLVVQAQGGLSTLSPEMRDALGTFVSTYTSLLLVPGIILAVGCRLHMLKKAEGKMGKLRAFTAGLTSFVGSVAVMAGIVTLACSSQTETMKNTRLSSHDLAEQSLIGSGAGIGGGLILALSALIAP